MRVISKTVSPLGTPSPPFVFSEDFQLEEDCNRPGLNWVPQGTRPNLLMPPPVTLRMLDIYNQWRTAHCAAGDTQRVFMSVPIGDTVPAYKVTHVIRRTLVSPVWIFYWGDFALAQLCLCPQWGHRHSNIQSVLALPAEKSSAISVRICCSLSTVSIPALILTVKPTASFVIEPA